MTLAVEQLLGAVDWVLDPENNQIVYKVPPTDPSNFPYNWCNAGIGCYTTTVAAGAGFLLYDNRLYPSYGSIRHEEKVNGNTLTVYVYNSSNQLKNLATFGYTANPNYNPNPERTLTLETVAQKVIENAENNNIDAQFAVLAAANNILSEAEQDDAKAKPIEDELEENKNNTCNPPAGVKFNKVTHYESHSTDPLKGTHGCMEKTGSPIHWHYSVNHQSSNGKCFLEKHAFGGCGVAPP